MTLPQKGGQRRWATTKVHHTRAHACTYAKSSEHLGRFALAKCGDALNMYVNLVFAAVATHMSASEPILPYVFKVVRSNSRRGVTN